MYIYTCIYINICTCIFIFIYVYIRLCSACAQELPSGLWEENLQDAFPTSQHKGPPGSHWWVLWPNWWPNPFLPLRMGRPLEWCRHGLLSSMATGQQTPQLRILEGSFSIGTLNKFDPSCLGAQFFTSVGNASPKKANASCAFQFRCFGLDTALSVFSMPNWGNNSFAYGISKALICQLCWKGLCQALATVFLWSCIGWCGKHCISWVPWKILWGIWRISNILQEYALFSPIFSMFIMCFAEFCSKSPVHENTCKIRAKYVQNTCFARAKIRPVQGAWISVEGAWISVQKPVQNTYFSWFWTIPIFHGFVQKNMKNLWKSIKFLWNVVFSPGNRLSWQISAEDRGSTRQRPAKGWGLVL